MESTLTATELARRLSDVLNRVRYRGERFVVERNGEAVAVLSPAAAPRHPTLRDLAAVLGDLALPGEGFAAELAAVQEAQPPAEAPPWPS